MVWQLLGRGGDGRYDVNHSSIGTIRRTVKAKAPLRVQLLLTFGGRGGEEQEASALLRVNKSLTFLL